MAGAGRSQRAGERFSVEVVIAAYKQAPLRPPAMRGWQ
jgi:hypothetical protein